MKSPTARRMLSDSEIAKIDKGKFSTRVTIELGPSFFEDAKAPTSVAELVTALERREKHHEEYVEQLLGKFETELRDRSLQDSKWADAPAPLTFTSSCENCGSCTYAEPGSPGQLCYSDVGSFYCNAC